MWGCGTSRKPGNGQIKSPPEKVYGAHLTDEFGTKLCKDPTTMSQDAPNPLCILAIIRCMFPIRLEWRSIRYFDRRSPDGYRHSNRPQGRHYFLIEFSY
ncbi:MAG TPA: hypothetical protein VE089_01285 [Nitrososphaeraceae archaeon]|nr:hypothetical protein [Nitrososphaeraceae archaeon]